MDAPVAAIEDALGAPVASVTRVGGGDFAAAYRVTLADATVVFAKTHSAPPPGFFTREAADLAWLDDAGSVLVPTVLAVSDGPVALLVLTWVCEGAKPDEVTFGRSLAGLHRAGAPTFGRADGRTTGSLELPNTPSPAWLEFFGGCRLEPLVRIAHDRRAVPRSTLDSVAIIAGHLKSFGVPEEPPARLHGDLWAGNRLADDLGRSWLVDPAAHGGHREFDLAMMRLFGGFGPACFASYDDAFPLADGWERRVPLHQLAPLLVHAIKFGGGYVDSVARTVRQLRSLL